MQTLHRFHRSLILAGNMRRSKDYLRPEVLRLLPNDQFFCAKGENITGSKATADGTQSKLLQGSSTAQSLA